MNTMLQAPQQNSTDRPAVRIVLEGVPRVGYFSGGQRCPEDVPFISCMRALLDYLGEGMGERYLSSHTTSWRLDNTYTYLLGFTGCAFRHVWGPGWRAENTDVRLICDDPLAPLGRAFQAAGYSMQLIAENGSARKESIYRAALERSLRAGYPVIGFGIIGPPEACLITGYEQGGDVVMGWNFYQDDPQYQTGLEFERCGYFRKCGWLASMQSMLLVGEKHPLLPSKCAAQDALLWALHVMRAASASRSQNADGWRRGQAAYHAWASDLLMDADFNDMDMDMLRHYFLAHDATVGMIAEGRWYGARFMEQLAEVCPAAEEALLSAGACLEMEHDLMWQVWGLVGGNGRSDAHVQKFVEPSTRREIASAIRQAQEQDRQAAGWIETALRAL